MKEVQFQSIYQRKHGERYFLLKYNKNEYELIIIERRGGNNLTNRTSFNNSYKEKE